MARFLVALIFLSATMVQGCDFFTGKRDEKDVIKFFEKGRVGSSPDFGLMKQSIYDPARWDLVAVFHGSVADYENCQDTARAVMAKAGGQYTCKQLNK